MGEGAGDEVEGGSDAEVEEETGKCRGADMNVLTELTSPVPTYRITATQFSISNRLVRTRMMELTWIGTPSISRSSRPPDLPRPGTSLSTSPHSPTILQASIWIDPYPRCNNGDRLALTLIADRSRTDILTVWR